MNINCPFFDLIELVCPHIYLKFGNFAWNFFDPRAIVMINNIRDRIGKPIYINSYILKDDKVNFPYGTEYDERGMRCIQCNIVKDMIELNRLYISAHLLAKGFDFEVKGMESEEVRTWLKLHENWWPYSFRIEKDVNWIHLDLYDNNKGLKIYEFTA